MRQILINGTDYTHYFTPKGIEVSYESVQGNNAGYMISGLYREDELAIKARITATCIPLSRYQVSTLLTEIYSNPYCTVNYFDTRTGTFRTIEARRSVTPGKYVGQLYSTDYWTGYAVTFIER